MFSCKIFNILRTTFFYRTAQRLRLRLFLGYFICREKCRWPLVSRMQTSHLFFTNKLLFKDVLKDNWLKSFLEISGNTKDTISLNVLTWLLWIFLLNKKIWMSLRRYWLIFNRTTFLIMLRNSRILRGKCLKWNLDFISKIGGRYNTGYANLPAVHILLYNMFRKEHPNETWLLWIFLLNKKIWMSLKHHWFIFDRNMFPVESAKLRAVRALVPARLTHN